MIPTAELLLLTDAVEKANAYAEEERVLTGYLAIYRGVLVVRGCSEPWAPELAMLWQRALDEYKLRYPCNWGPLD